MYKLASCSLTVVGLRHLTHILTRCPVPQPEASVSSSSSSSTSVPALLSFVHLHALVFKSRGLVDEDTPECVKNLSGQEAAAIGKTFDALVVKKEAGVAEKLAEGNDEEVLEGVSCESASPLTELVGWT